MDIIYKRGEKMQDEKWISRSAKIFFALAVLLAVYIVLKYAIEIIFPFLAAFIISLPIVKLSSFAARRLGGSQKSWGVFLALIFWLFLFVLIFAAIRRLLFEAGDDIDDLMKLCSADITSGIDEKVKRYLENFEEVKRRMAEVEEKDRVRNFQPPISGDYIMQTYGVAPCRELGLIKTAIKDAILEGTISNEFEPARQMMERLAAEYGWTKK
jgi:predicted PurR-regulated permease PerM